MSIRFQTKQRLVGLISGGLSLTVLAFLALNWPALKEQQKPSQKNSNEQASVKLEKATPTVSGITSKRVTLPAPPQLDVANRATPKKKPKKVKPLRTKLPNKILKSSAKLLKPILKPVPQLAPKAGPKAPTYQRQAADEIDRTVSETRKVVEKGRTLLRLLEHGSGPTIEFAWPDNTNEKMALYNVLVQCHGMRVALLDDRDRLFSNDSPPGTKWQINLDRYSTFIRQISGQSVDPERQEITRIKHRQSGLGSVTPVRIFTRQLDAYVLGNLGQILGAGYRSKRFIQARYNMNGNTILITDIVVDGVSKHGQILVPCSGK